MAKLKPCPFCGKPPKTSVVPRDAGITLKVYCGGACAVAQYARVSEACSFDTITQAMDNAMCAWNRRAEDGDTA